MHEGRVHACSSGQGTLWREESEGNIAWQWVQMGEFLGPTRVNFLSTPRHQQRLFSFLPSSTFLPTMSPQNGQPRTRKRAGTIQKPALELECVRRNGPQIWH
jgi:hypothetical protein